MSIIRSLHRDGAGIHLTGMNGLACQPIYGMNSAVVGGVHSFQETAESRMELSLHPQRCDLEPGRGVCYGCSYIAAMNQACPNCGSVITLPINAASCRIVEWARDPSSPYQRPAERSLRIAAAQLGVEDVDRAIALAIDPVSPQFDWHSGFDPSCRMPAPPENAPPISDRWVTFIRSFDAYRFLNNTMSEVQRLQYFDGNETRTRDCNLEHFLCPLREAPGCTHEGLFIFGQLVNHMRREHVAELV